MNMRRYLLILLSLVPVIVIYGTIFSFSAQTANDSAALSGKVTNSAVRFLVSNYDSLDRNTQNTLNAQTEHLIRKLAHFTEFALLGFFLLCHICAIARLHPIPFWGRAGIAFLLTAVSAAFDEMHQLWVDGRAPRITDVLIDSAGGLCGILLLSFFAFLIAKQKNILHHKRG